MFNHSEAQVLILHSKESFQILSSASFWHESLDIWMGQWKEFWFWFWLLPRLGGTKGAERKVMWEVRYSILPEAHVIMSILKESCEGVMLLFLSPFIVLHI